MSSHSNRNLSNSRRKHLGPKEKKNSHWPIAKKSSIWPNVRDMSITPLQNMKRISSKRKQNIFNKSLHHVSPMNWKIDWLKFNHTTKNKSKGSRQSDYNKFKKKNDKFLNKNNASMRNSFVFRNKGKLIK